MTTRFFIVHGLLLLLTIWGVYYLSFLCLGDHENTDAQIGENTVMFFIVRLLINAVAYLNVLMVLFLCNVYFSRKGFSKAFIRRGYIINMVCFIVFSLVFVTINIRNHLIH